MVGSWQLEEVLSAVPAESGKMFLEVTDKFFFSFFSKFSFVWNFRGGEKYYIIKCYYCFSIIISSLSIIHISNSH